MERDQTASDSAKEDATRGLRRLWRHELPAQPARRGPKPRVDTDQLVDRAIGLADAGGLAGLTVRGLAADLGLSRMAVYGYVTDRDELLELMVERVNATVLTQLRETVDGGTPDPLGASRSTAAETPRWKAGLRGLAGIELAACRRHPWLLDVPQERPVLGPASIGVYEHELAVLDGVGLSDLEMDQVRWQVINFVRGIAREEMIAAGQRVASATSTAQWWEQRAEFLAGLINPGRFPLATRVGAAVGESQGSAYDSALSYSFGLDRLLDGIEILINERARKR